jgi:osmotically-inducible protein OsmY
MTQRILIFSAVFAGMTLAQGCAPVIVAGGATAAVAANERRTLGSFVDDESIEIKARKALNDEPDFGDDVHINITSVNGIVLLTGETTTEDKRDRAMALIREIPGIRRIVSEVRVAEPRAFAYTTHDSWITSKVKAEMLGIKDLPSSQIKVVTENSVVYLMGLVTQKEGEAAAEAARTVGGITRVVKLFEYID